MWLTFCTEFAQAAAFCDKFGSMGVLERLKQRARAHPQRIVLPEGEDDRVIKAASRVARERYAKPTLLGRVDVIRASAERLSLKLDGVEILDVAVSPQLDEYARIYFERRRSKGTTLDRKSTRLNSSHRCISYAVFC